MRRRAAAAHYKMGRERKGPEPNKSVGARSVRSTKAVGGVSTTVGEHCKRAWLALDNLGPAGKGHCTAAESEPVPAQRSAALQRERAPGRIGLGPHSPAGSQAALGGTGFGCSAPHSVPGPAHTVSRAAKASSEREIAGERGPHRG
jgi:hypothetical protein